MPPSRKPGSRDLPPNLYQNMRNGAVYYRYRDPRTGRYHGMGSNKPTAIKDAKALNAAILAQMAGNRLEAIASGHTGITLSTLIARHAEYNEQQYSKGKLAANTIKAKVSIGRAIVRLKGAVPLADFGVADAAEIIQMYLDRDPPNERMAQSVRSEGIEIFKTGIALGMVKENPFAQTRGISVEVNRARLTLESFRAIYQRAIVSQQTWLSRSIELAILTGQRREDIASIEFRPRKEANAWVDGDTLYVIQQKTGNRVAIPLSLRLDALGLCLADVIAKCRDNIISRYAIHHGRGIKGSVPGEQVWKDTITRRFSDARDAAAQASEKPLWDAGKTPPTFHELRSLSERLYNEQGGIDTQVLLGHRDPRSTAIYKDSRGAEWMRVKAG